MSETIARIYDLATHAIRDRLWAAAQDFGGDARRQLSERQLRQIKVDDMLTYLEEGDRRYGVFGPTIEFVKTMAAPRELASLQVALIDGEGTVIGHWPVNAADLEKEQGRGMGQILSHAADLWRRRVAL